MSDLQHRNPRHRAMRHTDTGNRWLSPAGNLLHSPGSLRLALFQKPSGALRLFQQPDRLDIQHRHSALGWRSLGLDELAKYGRAGLTRSEILFSAAPPRRLAFALKAFPSSTGYGIIGGIGLDCATSPLFAPWQSGSGQKGPRGGTGDAGAPWVL
jgi:hypothetical protein